LRRRSKPLNLREENISQEGVSVVVNQENKENNVNQESTRKKTQEAEEVTTLTTKKMELIVQTKKIKCRM